VDTLSKHYRYVVIDNEAGMEHLSRRTTRDVNHLLIVSDPTQRGLVAASRIASFRKELDIRIENAYLILNRAPKPLPVELEEQINKVEIPLVGIIPNDNELTTYEFSGRPLVELEDYSPIYQEVAKFMSKIGL
jgi:CO dehydrogenase maturation factor